MKKLLIKIVALITAAAVASGGLVFGDDLGGTDEEILVVNGSLAEDEENDGFENENVRVESDENSDFDWDPEWDWDTWESMNWDGVEFTYEGEDYECRYGILNDGTVILLEYQDKYIEDWSDDESDELYEIDIPAQIDGKDVTVIGRECFKYIGDTVANIYIPSTVKLIGEYAFAECDSIISIEIPDSVTLIGAHAFEYCESLSSIVIPDSVTLIGAHAFDRCKSLSSIEINGAASIGDLAFDECVSLVSVEINNISSIGNGMFFGCTSLTSIEIPDSVVTIGESAFANCSSLSEAVIPDSIISIGWKAFSGCDLKNIYYTGNENLWNIIKIDYYEGYDKDFANLRFNYSDPDDFYYEDLEDGTIRLTGYSGAGSVNIPKTIDGKAVTVIGSEFLYSDGTITKVQIPDSVTLIEDEAFCKCSNLLEVTIPDSVTSIGEDAFDFCICLEDVYYTGTEEKWGAIEINSGNEYLTEAVCYAGDYRCEFLDDGSICLVEYRGNGGAVTIPSKIYGRDVTMIGGTTMFCDELTSVGDELTSVEIPDSVTQIGDYTFQGCDYLTSVKIPDSIVSIGELAFAGCGSLTSIEIPEGVAIGKFAFRQCGSLTSIEIPEGVSIGESAFSECISLTSIEIPEGVSIGESAFSECISLTSLEIPEGASIGESAFSECISLVSLEIPEGVSIGERAFANCDALTSIEFSEGVSIGERAFVGCDSLTSIEIPDGVTSISGGAFDSCRSLSSINVSAGNENYTSIDGCLYSKDGSKLLCYPAGKTEASFTIPEYVTSLGYYAFAGCNALASIEIPDSVTSIGGRAFEDCSSLTSIEIPDSVTSIGFGAFYNCRSLSSIKISKNVTSIETYTFKGCNSLTMVEIPDSVTSIGYSAFCGCSALTAVAIPDSVTLIKEIDKISESFFEAFEGCSPDLVIYGKVGSYAETYAKDHNIDFKPIEEFPPETPVDPDPGDDPDPDPDPDPDDPVSVTVGDYTVYFTEDNGALTITDITGSAPNLLIPAEINGKPVKAISETAFANTAALQSVYIPDSVDNIEGNPFAVCPDLTDIYYGGTENKWYIAASGIPFEDDPLPDVTFHFGASGGLSEEHPVEKAGKATVETAIKFNTGEGAPVIYIKGDQADITKEGLEVIKTLNTPVILQMKNYSLKINPDDIKTPSDFSILVKKADSSDNIEQWAEPANSLMIIPREPAKGNFGMTVEINLSEEDILPFSADSAHLYHIDGSGKIEDYSSEVSCDKDSKVVSVSLSHASKYLLTAEAVDLGGGTSSGSEPSEPTDPTDPADPSEPSEPMDPTDPADPSEPSEPTDPTDPSEPSEPTDPTDPTDPSEPSEPTDPTDPADPSEPSEPTDPTDPTDPSEPSEPTDPTDPSEPSEPTDPTDPTDPSEPSEPTDPTDPTDPSEPSEPTDPTDPANPSEPSNPEDPTDPTNPSEPSAPTTELSSGWFVVPETTTPNITTSTALENTAANLGSSAFSVEFESEETAEAAVTEDEAQPVTSDTSSEMSTTVPPDEAEVSLDTTDSSVGNSGDANAPIGNAGADEAQGDKNVNTGDSSVSLTPLMIISAAVVFNGTALFGKKKKDK